MAFYECAEIVDIRILKTFPRQQKTNVSTARCRLQAFLHAAELRCVSMMVTCGEIGISTKPRPRMPMLVSTVEISTVMQLHGRYEREMNDTPCPMNAKASGWWGHRDHAELHITRYSEIGFHFCDCISINHPIFRNGCPCSYRCRKRTRQPLA